MLRIALACGYAPTANHYFNADMHADILGLLDTLYEEADNSIEVFKAPFTDTYSEEDDADGKYIPINGGEYYLTEGLHSCDEVSMEEAFNGTFGIVAFYPNLLDIERYSLEDPLATNKVHSNSENKVIISKNGKIDYELTAVVNGYLIDNGLSALDSEFFTLNEDYLQEFFIG